MNTTRDDTSHLRRQALATVHLLNFQFLLALREALRADATRASYEYGIDVATASVVRNASDEGLRALSYAVDRAVFTLRLRGNEITDLLQRPPALRGLLVTVRAKKPGGSSGRRASATAKPPSTEADQ